MFLAVRRGVRNGVRGLHRGPLHQRRVKAEYLSCCADPVLSVGFQGKSGSLLDLSLQACEVSFLVSELFGFLEYLGFLLLVRLGLSATLGIKCLGLGLKVRNPHLQVVLAKGLASRISTTTQRKRLGCGTKRLGTGVARFSQSE